MKPTRCPRADWRVLLLVVVWTLARVGSLGAASDGTAPALGINPADPASIQAGVEKAVAQGSKQIVIPPGVYRLPGIGEPGKAGCHLRFDHLTDVEIDAAGVTLILMDPEKLGIVFIDCHGTTFRGARIQRVGVATSQGTIEAIDPAGKHVDVRVATGYPDDLTNPAKFDHFWSMLVSADGKEMLGGLRAREPLNIQPLEPGLFRIDLNEPIPASRFR